MLKYIKHFVEQSWLLIAASLIFGLALAIANAAWAPRIEQNRIDKLNNLIKGLLTEAYSFELVLEDVELEIGKGKKAKSDIYKAFSSDGRSLGWAFTAQGSGFADKIELVVATDKNFQKLAGFDVLSSNETPGFGDRIKNSYYRNQFKGVPTVELELSKTGDSEKIDDQIIAISGATVSSQAVVDILNNHIEQIKQHLKTKGLIDNDK